MTLSNGDKVYVYNDEYHKIPEFEVRSGTIMFKPSGDIYLVKLDKEPYSVLASKDQLYLNKESAYRELFIELELTIIKEKMLLDTLYSKRRIVLKTLNKEN